MNICLVCDFFHPKLGGVEMHIFSIALTLQQRGHKVIILTHKYANRTGIRYITHGIKVYYMPFTPIYDQVALFTVVGSLPLVRNILIYESIHIVHSHAATSYLGNEVLLHAQLMGYKTVFTDHSLFAFNDAASFHVNKILKFILADISHSISVSHISKENLAMRASLNPRSISVIPNAVDCKKFKPDPTKRNPTGTINIVVVCRLAFRKGVDLLIDIIPEVLRLVPQAYFIIGGDGPKRQAIEDMIDRKQLRSRVEMLGSVPSHKVRDVLVRGHIFLNTSLTEAFCIAIVEAASCGLFVVSTNVGGVVEVLPKHMMCFTEPKPQNLIDALIGATTKQFDPYKIHQQVASMYNWESVAIRTEAVYKQVLNEQDSTLIQKMKLASSSGPIFGLYIAIILIMDLLLLKLLDYWRPIRTFAMNSSGKFN